MNQDEPKKRGCCLGGCIGIFFWLSLAFAAGWYVCNLEHNAWDYKAAAVDGYHRVGNHVKNVWSRFSSLPTSEHGGKPYGGNNASSRTPKLANEIADWTRAAAEAQRNAARLLKSAEAAAGAQQARLLRMAQKELQAAYDDYRKAAQLDSSNQELNRKIAEIGKMLDKYKQGR